MQVQTLNTYLSTASAAGAGFAQEIHPWETWMGQHCERPRRQCLQHCGQGRFGSHRHAGGPRVSLSDNTKHDGESPPEFRIVSDRFQNKFCLMNPSVATLGCTHSLCCTLQSPRFVTRSRTAAFIGCAYIFADGGKIWISARRTVHASKISDLRTLTLKP